eukprot:Nk52_evm35s232 gene=Nk52_evmTU35s232
MPAPDYAPGPVGRNTLVTVDLSKPVREQATPLHNRWHPDIPAVCKVRQNEIFSLQTVDWTGGQIGNNDSAEDIDKVDLTQIHYLTGPVEVEGAEPGDLLVVDILDIAPLPGNEWGFTGVFSKENGGGFLTDEFPNACKTIWDFEGIYATSRHLPGVKFAGIMHPGLIGCAPSLELLEEWNRREEALVSTNPTRTPPLAELPRTKGALMGKMEGTKEGEVAKTIAARTIPGREHGGNCDIKNLSKGSRVYFPVYVAGAKLSVGDLHFSQGDGEISFCGGIEMAGSVTMRASVLKNGVSRWHAKNPIFCPGLVEPLYSRYLTFQGISVQDDGSQLYLDAKEAYRQACLNCIRYLSTFGYSQEQVYMLLSACPCEGRINGIVDIPNACCTIGIPVDIFDFDIMPGSNQNLAQLTGATITTASTPAEQ